MKYDFLYGKRVRNLSIIGVILCIMVSIFVLSFILAPREQAEHIEYEYQKDTIINLPLADKTVPPNECPDEPVNPSPYNGEIGVSTDTALCVYVNDSDQDCLEVSFYWCDGTLIQSIPDVPSGSIVCTDPLDLEESTEYCWYVEVNDGECIVTGPMNKEKVIVVCWCFTTEDENECPEEPIDNNPMDGEVLVENTISLCVFVTDPDGDDLDVHFYWCDETLIETITDVPSGTTVCTQPLSLAYDTTYYWYVKVTDGICEQSFPCWEFTTGPRPCQDIVYIDDDFTSDTPGFDLTHFIRKQIALDTLDVNGIAYVFDGFYNEPIIIDHIPCDNTGITQMGEYECFPDDEESALILSHEQIFVDNVHILYMEYAPSTIGSIIVEPDVCGTFLKCNKFNKDCISDAKGVIAKGETVVEAEYNWWGAPNGPDGGLMDDGSLAEGYGVINQGNVYVEPWIGIHAEISNPMDVIEVEMGTPLLFDGSQSWAYGYGECCEPELLHMQYEWDFGDGTYNHNAITTHIFESTGTYNVRFMVDSPGIPGLHPQTMYDWDEVKVIVKESHDTLSVLIGEDGTDEYQVTRNVPVQFTSVINGGNPPYIYNWDFGDNARSNNQNPIHSYNKVGTFSVVLTVIDSDWTYAQDSIDVTVIDSTKLNATIQSPSDMVKTNQSVHFIADATGGFKPYDAQWIIEDKEYSGFMIEHSFGKCGIYTVELQITDQEKTVKRVTKMITVDDTDDLPMILDVLGGFGCTVKIETSDEPVVCEIRINGPMVIGGITSEQIPARSVKMVDLGFILGFGPVDIMVSINEITKTYDAFMIGPFVVHLQ